MSEQRSSVSLPLAPGGGAGSQLHLARVAARAAGFRGLRLASQRVRQRRSGLAPKRPPQDQSITPRCHFCGGPHWIYNCPHMDESSEGREKRRRQSRHRTLTKTRHYPDDESQESGSSIDDSRNTSGYTTLTGATSDGGVCAQSNPFQCQICFGFR